MVYDQGRGEIARSLQLIAGRVGQEYNKRKRRKGAFWEDRYHATAIDTHSYLAKCLLYVDLNMVRAGVVQHPRQWAHCGFREMQDRPQRYQITDNAALMDLLGLSTFSQLQRAREEWLAESLADPSLPEHRRWPEGLAWGSRAFIEEFKSGLGIRGQTGTVFEAACGYSLKEPATSYHSFFNPKKTTLRL
jgi:putative transposase